MTFRKIIALVLLISTSGCSAPEVRPPEPSPSPRELGTLGIANAQAGSLSSSSRTEEATPSEKGLEEPPPQENQEDSQQPPEPQNQPISFPAEGKTLQENMVLTGPGGRAILTLTKLNQSVQVLEELGERYRVICRQCDPKRPFQAGYLLKEQVEITR